MANNLRGNPLRVDTAATVITEETLIQCLEWVSDTAAAGGAMAAADKLIMEIDGTVVELLCVIALTQTWVSHLHVPIQVKSLVVSLIDGGTLLIWKA